MPGPVWSEPFQLCSNDKVCQDGLDMQDFQRLEEGEMPRGKSCKGCLVESTVSENAEVR